MLELKDAVDNGEASFSQMSALLRKAAGKTGSWRHERDLNSVADEIESGISNSRSGKKSIAGRLNEINVSLAQHYGGNELGDLPSVISSVVRAIQSANKHNLIGV